MLFFKQEDKIKELKQSINDYKRIVEILQNKLTIYYNTQQELLDYVNKIVLDNKKHDLDAILITILVMLREGEENVNSCI